MMSFAFVMVWKGRRNHPNKAALLWSLGCSVVAFFGAGVWGFLHTLHGVNYYTHGTQVTAAHGHLAFFGAYVMLNLAMITYAMPVLRGREPYNQVLNMASFWLMTSGMAFMTFTLTFAGVVQTHLQRVMGDVLHGGAGPARALLPDAVRRGLRGRARRAPLHLQPGRRRGARSSRPARRPCRESDDERPRRARAPSPSTAPSPTNARSSRRRTATGLPLLLKGPTGCGKTRFVEHMAARLGLPLFTVACHDDLSAADLIGRYLLKGGETVWVDGPADPRRARGRHLLPRRGGGGAQGRDRRPAPADRRPPPARHRPHRRGAGGAAPPSCSSPATTPATRTS